MASSQANMELWMSSDRVSVFYAPGSSMQQAKPAWSFGCHATGIRRLCTPERKCMSPRRLVKDVCLSKPRTNTAPALGNEHGHLER
eukprot:100934-Pelagomonas_calceolata.AAC.1